MIIDINCLVRAVLPAAFGNGCCPHERCGASQPLVTRGNDYCLSFYSSVIGCANQVNSVMFRPWGGAISENVRLLYPRLCLSRPHIYDRNMTRWGYLDQSLTTQVLCLEVVLFFLPTTLGETQVSRVLQEASHQLCWWWVCQKALSFWWRACVKHCLLITKEDNQSKTSPIIDSTSIDSKKILEISGRILYASLWHIHIALLHGRPPASLIATSNVLCTVLNLSRLVQACLCLPLHLL